jgi:CobQ-like glutamine amidotransferase family enzyme
MNIYADRGNLLLLERRCNWRGVGFSVERSGLGDQLDPGGADLYYIGGGQDRDQELCAYDLAEVKRDALHAAAERGAVILAVCGGYQLLGHSYQLGDDVLPGVGLVDLHTVRAEGDAKRLIGNVAIEVELPEPVGAASPPDREPPEPARAASPPDRAPTAPVRRVLAGFENHGGRTHLGPGTTPLGRVINGHGNNGQDGYEGVRAGNVIGTYLHGPLLPKNAWFADWLIATALEIDGPLEALNDELEEAAHAEARRAAGL